MDGVVVLNTSEYIASYTPGMNAWVWMSIVAGISLLVLAIVCICDIDVMGPMFVVPIMGAVFIGMLGCSFYARDEPVMAPQYEVYIEEGTDMTEFLSHYEIVDQKGKILIVREADEVEALDR